MTDQDKRSEYKIDMLACPACGGQIGGSGSCPSCGQLLIVTKNRQLLQIKPEDIEDIKIKPPSKEEREAKDNPIWEVGNSMWTENKLMVIANGAPEYGAKLVAFYYAKHPEATLPGTQVPSIEKIDEFALSTVIKQNMVKGR